ncbi:UDP-N-acetylmuramate dehydrogenase [Castellaniella sp.]|uniref:UDP-N-acetylmuramate dehydrogenase n=1 Tax=Castellaniella sp. TaxID=1955812 RepID=UPI003C7949CA
MSLAFTEQSLQPCNTLGLPARAQVARLEDEADLPSLCGLPGAPLFVLGGGSNVVMLPQPGHRVVQVALKGIRLWQETADCWLIEAAAGEPWHAFVAYCLQQGWPGLENLALIPGTVGAAPVQNIGAYGLELSECLHSVVAWDLYTGLETILPASECGFGYRDSRFKRDGAGRWLITRVRFALPKQWVPRLAYPDLQRYVADWGKTTPTALQIFDAVCEIRRHKLPDPAVQGNAGSFFKNPVVDAEQAQALLRQFTDLRVYPQAGGRVKLAAGWLIEQAGWKGRQLGPVGMHPRQALVLVNHGGACAADVVALAQAVQQAVADQFGVALEQEPVMLD